MVAWVHIILPQGRLDRLSGCAGLTDVPNTQTRSRTHRPRTERGVNQ